MKDLKFSLDELGTYRKKIVESIRIFVETAGAKGAVLGLSGGIDSSLVATLAKSALGDRVQVLIMPETGVSRKEDVEHAITLAEEEQIRYRVLELKEVLESIRSVYPELLKTDDGFLARANLAPRVRMVFNYAVSNLEELIVLGTGNKTELLLGYYTKYGDGGVDILPIGDLYKTQVRQLACHIGVPDCIVDKPPSAGLWHGQTDEEELGASYETIDRVLFQIYERGRSIEETTDELKLDRAMVERIYWMTRKNAHKRFPPEIVKL